MCGLQLLFWEISKFSSTFIYLSRSNMHRNDLTHRNARACSRALRRATGLAQVFVPGPQALSVRRRCCWSMRVRMTQWPQLCGPTQPELPRWPSCRRPRRPIRHAPAPTPVCRCCLVAVLASCSQARGGRLDELPHLFPSSIAET
jgi:hypothetical protein